MKPSTYQILDQAAGGRPLRMRVEPDAHGVCVTALDDRNQPLGAVMLDFFSNRLSAVVTKGWEDEPQPMQKRSMISVPAGSGRTSATTCAASSSTSSMAISSARACVNGLRPPDNVGSLPAGNGDLPGFCNLGLRAMRAKADVALFARCHAYNCVALRKRLFMLFGRPLRDIADSISVRQDHDDGHLTAALPTNVGLDLFHDLHVFTKSTGGFTDLGYMKHNVRLKLQDLLPGDFHGALWVCPLCRGALEDSPGIVDYPLRIPLRKLNAVFFRSCLTGFWGGTDFCYILACQRIPLGLNHPEGPHVAGMNGPSPHFRQPRLFRQNLGQLSELLCPQLLGQFVDGPDVIERDVCGTVHLSRRTNACRSPQFATFRTAHLLA